MNTPLNTFSFYSRFILFSQKQSMTNRLLKLSIGTVCIGASAYLYNRLSQINDILGTTLIDSADKQFRQERQDQIKLLSVEKNPLSVFNHKIDIILVSWEERLRVYCDRLIYFDRYQQFSRDFLNQLVIPIIDSYEKEGIFEEQQIVKALQEEGSFNNRLTKDLMMIAQKNSKIISKKKGYLTDMIQWQEKLMTLRILGLNSQMKHKIDILYHYNLAKIKSMALIDDSKDSLIKQKNYKQILSDEGEKDYLNRLQFLA